MHDRALLPGSYVAFHDFIDPRNFDPAFSDYGVAQGAADGLSSAFAFVGGCGCMGIYQFKRLGRPTEAL